MHWVIQKVLKTLFKHKKGTKKLLWRSTVWIQKNLSKIDINLDTNLKNRDIHRILSCYLETLNIKLTRTQNTHIKEPVQSTLNLTVQLLINSPRNDTNVHLYFYMFYLIRYFHCLVLSYRSLCFYLLSLKMTLRNAQEKYSVSRNVRYWRTRQEGTLT